MTINNPFLWNEDFPPIYGHTSVAFLKHCPGFEKAKLGDMQAALAVVNFCVKPRRVIEVRQKYPDAVLLPVITDNKLPEAFAQIIGLKVYNGIYEIETLNRKTLSAMERLLHKPSFGGRISHGKSYIIVDDIVTQGGTVSALRKYVIINGGFVVAIMALAYSAGSGIIAPSIQDIYDLIDKFNYAQITNILTYYRIANNPWELTKSQIRYLLRFSGIKKIVKKIEKSIQILKTLKQGAMGVAKAMT